MVLFRNLKMKAAAFVMTGVCLLASVVPAHAYQDEEFRKELQPGEWGLIYEINASPTMINQPITFTDFESMKEKAAPFVTLPEHVKPGYSFKEGFIQTKLLNWDTREIEKELEKEAKQTGKTRVMKIIQAFDDFLSLSYTLENEKGEKLFFNIFNPNGQMDVSTLAFGEIKDRFTIHDQEAIFLTFSSPNNGEMKQVKWRKSGSDKIYTLGSNAPDVSKEDLVSMASLVE